MSDFLRPIHLFTLTLALALTGCSTSQPEPPPQPSALRIVTLNSEIATPANPEFKGGGGSITKALDAMGANINNSRVEELKTLMTRGGVDVRRQVLDSLRKELEKSGVPVKIVERDGEADLRLHIETYGIDRGLEWSVVPSIDMRASLVRADGTVIWEGHEYIDRRHQFRKGVQTNSLDNYQKNPAQLQADFSANIDVVISALIEALKEDHANGDIGPD